MKVALAALVVALATAASVGATAKPVAFFGCRAIGPHPTPIVKPGSMIIACGDGNFFLTQIKWATWKRTTAAGSAVAHQNDCRPNCAAGHFHVAGALVTLSKVRSCKGRQVFVHVAWTVAGRHPDGLDFPC